MEFKQALSDAQIYLTEMTVNGLISALSKDTGKVDSVILPRILKGVESGGYSPGLRDDMGNEVDATTAYDQVCRSLGAKGINIAKSGGKLVSIINRLASGNKLRNSPVRLPDQKKPTWNPIQRRVPGLGWA
jgi:hypothetical protein